MFVLAMLLILPLAFVLIGCGGETKSNINVYNTKDMTDAEILEYFSDSVLNDVKTDVRNRSIVVYNVDENVSDETNFKWELINQEGQVAINSDAETGIYVDKDAPETETKIVKIMIGWEEQDIDQTWTVNIYYLNNAEERVDLATCTINAPSNNSQNIYIHSATLNGKEYSKTYYSHTDLQKGGTLQLNMQAAPNKQRGIAATDRPYSFSTENNIKQNTN